MKQILMVFFTLFILFLGVNTVSAKDAVSDTYAEISTVEYLAPSDSEECDALFGDPDKAGTFAYYLQKILEVMRYVAIVACIALTIVDFMKAVLSDNKDMLKPLTSKAFNRLCYAIMLFFLPNIVKIILELVGVYGTCSIS